MSRRKKKRNGNKANAQNNTNIKLVQKEDNEEMKNAIGFCEKVGKKLDGFGRSKGGKAIGILAILAAIGAGAWKLITHFFGNDCDDDTYYDDPDDGEEFDDSSDDDEDDAAPSDEE